jgi:hypothetical protein
MGLRPEQIIQWYELQADESADTLGDGTYYYPNTGGWGLGGILDTFYLYVDVTDGVAGDWTVTIEAQFRGDTGWRDKTNDWFSVASWTADAELDRTTVTTCLQAVRIKAIRANDTANTDGAIDIKGAFQRKGVS